MEELRKEQQPTHYQKYCETIKASSRRWYEAHKNDERVKELRKQIAERNKEANREISKRINKEKYQNDPEYRERKKEQNRLRAQMRRQALKAESVINPAIN